MLSVAAALFCLGSFCMFFINGVTDDGGDGLQAYLIAFDVQVSGLHFNALAFFAYVLPLVCAAAAFIPFKRGWMCSFLAVILLLCAIAQMNLCSIYLLKYSEEVREMYLAAGVRTSDNAYLSAINCIVAGILLVAKGLYPFCKRKLEERV